MNGVSGPGDAGGGRDEAIDGGGAPSGLSGSATGASSSRAFRRSGFALVSAAPRARGADSSGSAAEASAAGASEASLPGASASEPFALSASDGSCGAAAFAPSAEAFGLVAFEVARGASAFLGASYAARGFARTRRRA